MKANPLLLTATMIVAAFTAGTSRAQTWTWFPKYVKYYGNSDLGGKVFVYSHLDARSSSTYRKASAEMFASADVNLLGRTRQIARVWGLASDELRMSSRGDRRYRRATLELEIVGRKLDWLFSNSQANGASIGWSRTLKMFPVDPSLTFYISVVPVTVHANAAIGLSTSARFGVSTSATPSAGITGSASMWGQASAGIAVGTRVLSSGIEVVGQLANQTLSINAGANASSGLSGSVDYRLRAIAVKLRFFARTIFGSLYKTLASWSSSEIRRTLASF